MKPVLRKQFLVLSILAGVLVTVFGPLSCRNKIEPINFGAIPSGSAVLIYLAQDRHYFADHGVSVHIKDYATGVGTIDALLRGDVDIAWAAEFPLVKRAFHKDDISIIAALSRFSDQYLFGRKDRGIRQRSDLKAKKIGIPRHTISEFYLARFLDLNGVDMREVDLVDVPPPQSLEALTSGKIDGVVTWEPYSSRIKVQLADKVTAWPVQNSQPGYGVIIGRNDWIKGHSDLIQRFLKSLVRAEGFLVRDSDAAKDILKKRVNYDDAFVEIFWAENQFSLFLDQSLILAMEDEARWMIRSNLVEADQVPDFMDHTYENDLKAVKPEAVNIIR